MKEQNWFKIWPKFFLKDEKLRGPENVRRRGAFASVLSVAKVCKCGGRLINSMDEEMTFEEVVTMAGITKSDYQDLLDVELVSCNQGLHFIKNWAKYQSDYDRQKKYRHPKVVTKGDKVVTKGTPRDGDLRLKKEIETEVEKQSNSNGEIPKDIQRRLDKIDEYSQMLQNPKYGSDQCDQFKLAIKMLEDQIDEINKRNGHKQPVDLDF